MVNHILIVIAWKGCKALHYRGLRFLQGEHFQVQESFVETDLQDPWYK